MIKKSISKTFNDQMHALECMKDLMLIEAIKDDGIYSTFEFDKHWLKAPGLTKITLQYYRLFDGDGCSWTIVKKYIFYKTCPEIGDATLPSIWHGTLDQAINRIKMDMVKKDNAIWSTIIVQPCHDHFDVSYKKAYADNDKEDTLKWSPSAAVVDPYVENTKRTLRRIQENSYYGLYPRPGLTCNFDEKLKEDIKASLGIWKAKTDLDIHSPSEELLRSYGTRKKEEKENKDMNVTLMVVPNGMNKDFVNKVKANFQSNNSMRLFVASTDINFNGKYEPLKTKYNLFENWVKTGKVDVVYFMLGFEKDPDVRAFESFVRGITEAEVPGKVDVRVVYQKDDILNDVNNLRTAYFDEADAKEDLHRAGDKVIKEVMTMSDVYGLDSKCLDAIENSKCRIDASDELVMGKIMEAAFASNEDTKPAKKGGEK